MPNEPYLSLSAEGPDELRSVLQHVLDQKTDVQASSQYILYKVGALESLIKINRSSPSFQFFYCDYLFGRPAPMEVKNILKEMAWEKGGEKERYLQQLEVTKEQRQNPDYLQKAYAQWKESESSQVVDISRALRAKEQASFLSGRAAWHSMDDPFLTKNNEEARRDAFELLEQHISKNTELSSTSAKPMHNAWTNIWRKQAQSAHEALTETSKHGVKPR
jgi:hypothetical protein